MRRPLGNLLSRLWLPAVLLLPAAWSLAAQAAEQTKADTPVVKPVLKSEGAVPAKPGEPTYAFEMRDKRWESVFEWFSNISGLPVIYKTPPQASFSYTTPTPHKYTVTQILDIINGALLVEGHVLIRQDQNYLLVPASDKIDSTLVPRIPLDDLDKRGNTEIVSVVVPLRSQEAEDAAPEFKEMLGNFGKIVAMKQANKLVIQDTVRNIKRIVQTIKANEDAATAKVDSFSYTCKYIKARDAEQRLKELLGDPERLIRQQQSMNRGAISYVIGPDGRQQMQRGPTQSNTEKVRMHYVTADERTNTVLVTGPADKIAQAKNILTQLDVATKGQPPVLIGHPFSKAYPVPSGMADAIVKSLKEVYKDSSTLRISSLTTNKVSVFAMPEDQMEIERQIAALSEKSISPEVVPLENQDASKMVTLLQGIFGDYSKNPGVPFVDADPSGANSIVIRGSAEQVADVKAVLKALGETGQLSGNMRSITIDKGNAAALANELQRLMKQLSNNPVRVITPGQDKPAAKKPSSGSSCGDAEEEEEPPATTGSPLVAQQQPKKNATAGTEGAPVTITAIGNKLIITSDDPKALALVQDLTRLLTKSPDKERLEVIPLKYASAVDVAKVLDEVFNGPKNNQQNNPFAAIFGGRGGRFGGPMPATTTTPETPVRIVADPATNSLLVRAAPSELAQIRNLLDTSLDTDEKGSKGLAKTFVIGPLKYANATEVADIIKDVYREHTNNNPVGQVGGGRSFFRRGSTFVNQNIDANGNSRPVDLSLGVDDRSNSLIVMCSTALHDNIKSLAEQLDTAAKDSTRTVRVVSVKGVDPMLVQQAIDAIQGRRTNNGQQGYGAPGFTPFGTGGFVPGMGSPFGGRSSFRGGFPGGGSGFPTGPGGYSPSGGTGPPGTGGGRSSSTTGGGRSGSGSGGPGFFADRVKDDPELTVLFDPQRDPLFVDPRLFALAQQTILTHAPADLHLVKHEEQQPPTGTSAPPAESPNLRGPRGNVNVEALQEFGAILVSGNNQADVEEILRIIDFMIKFGAGAEYQIQFAHLQYSDATSVSNTLSQLFRNVQILPTANVPVRGATTTGAAQQPGAAQGPTSVVLIPVVRQNALIVSGPRDRMRDIFEKIRELDRPNAIAAQPKPFALKKASAAQVDAMLTTYLATRYPVETTAQNQIRITHDNDTNTVFVQAAPADMAEIAGMIEYIDSTVSRAVNDIRIIPLKNVLSDELAALLQQAVSLGIALPTTTPGVPGVPTTPGIPTAPTTPTGLRPPGTTTTPGTVGTGYAGATTKTTTLRFVLPTPGGSQVFESGLLEDIHITSYARINALIVEAPDRSMQLLETLIKQLDTVPSLLAEIKVFTLRTADASAMAIMLQQMFLGTSSTTGAPTTGAPTSGFPGAPGGTTPVGPTFPGATSTGARQLTPMTLTGGPPEGAPLVDLRLAVDVRTNSIIVAGSRNDVDVIEAIIAKLEDTEVQNRRNHVYHVRNSTAADLANALTTFWTNNLTVLRNGQILTPYQDVLREVVVVPEPITNQLLISVTPKYYDEIMKLIIELDAEPPQVVIQALVAEVDLNNTDEFGVEIGLQTPVLFRRGIFPTTGTNTVMSVINATTGVNTGLAPAGAGGVTTAANVGLPGYLFNSTGALGGNVSENPGVVGFQGLGNLGVGRVSPNSSVGGFVFSAASDTFSLLVRALATQGRMEVLSRPQLQTLDNQTATMLIGQNYPYLNSTSIALGTTTSSVIYQPVGVILNVTPRISPDGKVLMRVQPEISSVLPQINLGGGFLGTPFAIQTVTTTVLAGDGETVVIGGLIQKRDNKTENKIPWFGDLPGVGALFRFRQQQKSKTELMIILTPHIIRHRADAEAILAQEARRMDWMLQDVIKMHGPQGLEPIIPPPQGPPAFDPSAPPMALPGPELTPPTPVTPEKPEVLPGPRPAQKAASSANNLPPSGLAPMPANMPSATPAPQITPVPRPTVPPIYAPPTGYGPNPTLSPKTSMLTPASATATATLGSNSTAKETENRQWNVFGKWSLSGEKQD